MISFHHLLYLFIKVSSCAGSTYSRVLVFDLFVRVTPCAIENWETIADRAPNELLSPPSLPDVSTLSMEDNKAQITKRRGRGTFSYQKEELYSDRQSEGSTLDDTRDEMFAMIQRKKQK
ncbi:hypothetical protein CK203_008271 [Vitis vinifera]|uniref:Uncharacterized protein n=1 Tax=Vitis vinifera TaxID=29760 RepID=A0A438KNU4_VITVI|nr:hypothetical protein CK203_008271 [Vitis vinifera]